MRMRIHDPDWEYEGGARAKKQKNPARVKAGKRASRKNKWIQYYRRWLQENPNLGGRRGIKKASQEYQTCKEECYL